ncbi:hypothetical protein [Promicromonospora sp. NFX87]|uniref:hypothetical protein n=1 Tax=Promicromonospora sp. NFX87 TaxID=3402691 RepID=UPI003AFB393C
MNQSSEEPTARPRATTARLLPAGAVLAGALLSLFGWSWDIQWHNDVGPDTFFTLPHLFLYTGSALCGLTALTVVLRTTAAQRSGRPVDAGVGGGSVRVFGGAFLAPVAYLVTGSAAAVFLLYGLWDQWWHGLYGFDAVLNSPPHVGLLLGNVTTIVGATMVFAAARHERWGRIGVVASLGMMVTFIPVVSDVFQQVPGVIDWITVCVAGLTALLLVMAMALFQRTGAALLVSVAVAALQVVLWLFTPWATHAYADSVGLPMRDFVAPVPIVPSWIPVSVVVAALILEGARALGRSRRWSARVVMPLWGGRGVRGSRRARSAAGCAAQQRPAPRALGHRPLPRARRSGVRRVRSPWRYGGLAPRADAAHARPPGGARSRNRDRRTRNSRRHTSHRHTRSHRMSRILSTLLVLAALLLTNAAPASAFEPVTIVHTERVEAGPYRITVGFSRWPIRAMQSLDFTFCRRRRAGGHVRHRGRIPARPFRSRALGPRPPPPQARRLGYGHQGAPR